MWFVAMCRAMTVVLRVAATGMKEHSRRTQPTQLEIYPPPIAGSNSISFLSKRSGTYSLSWSRAVIRRMSALQALIWGLPPWPMRRLSLSKPSIPA